MARPFIKCCESPKQHVRLSRSFRSLIPAFLLALVFAYLAHHIFQLIGFSQISLDLEPLGQQGIIELSVFPVLLVFFALRPLTLLWDCRHEIACHHLRSESGLISLTRESIEIPYEDMLGVRVEQSILDRILGVGTVLAWTATTDRSDIAMKGITRPDFYAKILVGRIDEALERVAAKRERAVG